MCACFFCSIEHGEKQLYETYTVHRRDGSGSIKKQRRHYRSSPSNVRIHTVVGGRLDRSGSASAWADGRRKPFAGLLFIAFNNQNHLVTHVLWRTHRRFFFFFLCTIIIIRVFAHQYTIYDIRYIYILDIILIGTPLVRRQCKLLYDRRDGSIVSEHFDLLVYTIINLTPEIVCKWFGWRIRNSHNLFILFTFK